LRWWIVECLRDDRPVDLVRAVDGPVDDDSVGGTGLFERPGRSVREVSVVSEGAWCDPPELPS
jgi:hypothetical protein